MRTRDNNPFGESTTEFRRILDDLREVEPQLRAAADHEIETTHPLQDVGTALASELGRAE